MVVSFATRRRFISGKRNIRKCVESALPRYLPIINPARLDVDGQIGPAQEVGVMVMISGYDWPHQAIEAIMGIAAVE